MEGVPATEPRKSWKTALASFWTQLRSALPGVSVQRRQRRLRLCETLSLGEKRIVAVVEFDDQRFLVAATSQNISLLQSLGPAQPEKHPVYPQ